jgi:hypothetical protein
MYGLVLFATPRMSVQAFADSIVDWIGLIPLQSSAPTVRGLTHARRA